MKPKRLLTTVAVLVMVVPLFLSFIAVLPSASADTGIVAFTSQPFRPISDMERLGARVYAPTSNIAVSLDMSTWTAGKLNDFSGHDYDATHTGTPTEQNTTVGVRGGCIDLSGSNYLTITDGTASYKDTANGMLLSFWIKMAATTSRNVVEKTSCWKVFIESNVLKFQAYDTTWRSATSITLSTGVWIHVAWSVQNGSIDAYKNGALVGTTTTYVGPMPTNNNAITFAISGGYGRFVGQIDEFVMLKYPMLVPASVSIPVLYTDAHQTVYTGNNFTYQAYVNRTADWTLSTNASFIHLNGSAVSTQTVCVYGTPLSANEGFSYWFNLTASATNTVYQNRTFYVSYPSDSSSIGVSGNEMVYAWTDTAYESGHFVGVDDTTVLAYAVRAYVEGVTGDWGKNMNFPDSMGTLVGIDSLTELWTAYFDCMDAFGLTHLRISSGDTWASGINWVAYRDHPNQFFQVFDSLLTVAEARSISIDLNLLGTASATAYAFDGTGSPFAPSSTDGTAYYNMMEFWRDVCYYTQNRSAIFAYDIWNEADHDWQHTNYWDVSYPTTHHQKYLLWAQAVSRDIHNFTDERLMTIGCAGQGTMFYWGSTNFKYSNGWTGVDILHRHQYGDPPHTDYYWIHDPIHHWADTYNKPLYWGEIGDSSAHRNTWFEERLFMEGCQAYANMELDHDTYGWPVVVDVWGSWNASAWSGVAWSFVPSTNLSVTNVWDMETNATGLGIWQDSADGVVYWTADDSDFGSYWVNVSVVNSCGSDYYNATVVVYTEEGIQSHEFVGIHSVSFRYDGVVKYYSTGDDVVFDVYTNVVIDQVVVEFYSLYGVGNGSYNEGCFVRYYEPNSNVLDPLVYYPDVPPIEYPWTGANVSLSVMYINGSNYWRYVVYYNFTEDVVLDDFGTYIFLIWVTAEFDPAVFDFFSEVWYVSLYRTNELIPVDTDDGSDFNIANSVMALVWLIIVFLPGLLLNEVLPKVGFIVGVVIMGVVLLLVNALPVWAFFMIMFGVVILMFRGDD